MLLQVVPAMPAMAFKKQSFANKNPQLQTGDFFIDTPTHPYKCSNGLAGLLRLYHLPQCHGSQREPNTR